MTHLQIIIATTKRKIAKVAQMIPAMMPALISRPVRLTSGGGALWQSG